MFGHFDNHIEGATILWPDASLKRIEVGYNEYTMLIHEEIKSLKLLRCIGYVGFQMIGFWDETIIETATIHVRHQFINDCQSRLKKLPKSDSESRKEAGNRLLEIVFIDGCKLWVCANKFCCELN